MQNKIISCEFNGRAGEHSYKDKQMGMADNLKPNVIKKTKTSDACKDFLRCVFN
jgi:hypothetical protein